MRYWLIAELKRINPRFDPAKFRDAVEGPSSRAL
jgi:hypothetical protein